MAASLVLAQSALGEDFIPGGQEKFTFRLGGISSQFDTTVRLDGDTTRGSAINLEGHGLDANLQSLDVAATWRFAERHRLDFNYFGAKRDASRTYSEEIHWQNEVIPVGFNVSLSEETNYYYLDYRYSFFKTDALELAGVLGLYTANVTVGLSATGVQSGITRSINLAESTSLPVPLVGASLDWYILPQWRAATQLTGMTVNFGNIDGTATMFTASTEYMFIRNLGVGMTYQYTGLDVDVGRSGFSGSLNMSNSAFLVYATTKF